MNAQVRGYFRFPTIHADKVVFVAEDDLWEAPAIGGVARRLTANLGAVSHPLFSPDGEWLAFVGREEGHAEVYLMAACGGRARRLPWKGSDATVVGWYQDRIVYASDAGRPAASTSGCTPSTWKATSRRGSPWRPHRRQAGARAAW